MQQTPTDFQQFTSAAIKGLNKKEAKRVGLALDVAIAFGAIEARNGNESLNVTMEELRAIYSEKLSRLLAMVTN